VEVILIYQSVEFATRTLGTLAKLIGVFMIAIAIGMVVGVFLDWYNANLTFSRKVGDFFELADQASSAHQKLTYFNEFTAAMESEHLTNGETALFFPRPRNDLANLWNITLSLQASLQNLDRTCQLNGTTSFACSNSLQEISITEFCWFPIDIIHSGWLIKNGHGIYADWSPKDQADRCSTTTSSSHSPF